MTDTRPERSATAVVLDDEGHLLVDAAALDGTDSVWVRCNGSAAVTAKVVASDDRSDLAVLKMDEPGGVPASVGSGIPRSGSDLVVVRPGASTQSTPRLAAEGPGRSTADDAVRLVASDGAEQYEARVDPASAAGTMDLSGDMLFDLAGRLAGVVRSDPGDGTVQVLSGADAIDIAQRLLGR
jgi:S1-C subfamily serine protease